MLPYLSKNIPIVFLYNNIESFFDFLNWPQVAAACLDRLIFPIDNIARVTGRDCPWGDPKLVYVSAAVPHANDVCDFFHFPHTDYLFPANPSPWLSLDILQEPLLSLIAWWNTPGPGNGRYDNDTPTPPPVNSCNWFINFEPIAG